MSEYLSIRESVDIQLIDEGQQKIIYLSCKLGISEPLALIAAVGPILISLDGSRQLIQIKEQFALQGVKPEIIDRVVSLLDQKHYLNSESFIEKKKLLLEEFKSSSIRQAAHAGRVYSSDPQELNKYLDKIFSDSQVKQEDNSNLFVLIAPHIDYRRGEAAYVSAYSKIKGLNPDLCFILGTSHQAGKYIFQFCNKDFACPNGTLLSDKQLISEIAEDYGQDRAFADELLHRQEHSLELQLPFLNYFCPNTKIVPILVRGFHQYLRGRSKPELDPEYSDFIRVISKKINLLLKEGKKILIVAGVDMAHMGQNFGDDFLIDQSKLNQIKIEDQEYLDSISALSSENMFNHISKDLDRRRICGFPTLHMILDLINKLDFRFETKIFDYQQALDPEKKCLVTFAAAGIYKY